MTDSLRTRIAAVQLGHMPDDYERDLGQCRCGFKYQKHWDLASHVADAVIRELRRIKAEKAAAFHSRGSNLLKGDDDQT